MEIVSNAYDESGRRVIQLNIRDLSDRRLEAGSRAGGDGLRDLRGQAPVERFAGIVGRDFGNLLTAIVGYTRIVEQSLSGRPDLTPDVAELKRLGERGVQVTRQLLAVGHTHSSDPESLDLNQIVLNLEQVMRVMLPGNIEVQIQPSQQPVTLRINRFEVEQIALELVMLAGESMSQGGTVKMESAFEAIDAAFSLKHPEVSPGEYAALRVTATGAEDGTNETPFGMERARSVAGVKGLVTAVRQANGYLWSYSELGKGSTATVVFPRTAPEPVASELSELPSGSETILLVDPDPAVRRVTREVLRERGYVVHEAAGGAAAVKLVEEGSLSIQLLVTEVRMSNMNGPELARRLGVTNGGALYTTGDTDFAIAQFGLEKDGKAVLRKPFTPEELAHAVRDTLDR